MLVRLKGFIPKPDAYQASLELRHLGLHEYRLLKAPNHYVLKNKADTQLAAWHDKWQRITSKAAIQQSKS